MLLKEIDFAIAYFGDILRVKTENNMPNMSKKFFKKSSNMTWNLVWVNGKFFYLKFSI